VDRAVPTRDMEAPVNPRGILDAAQGPDEEWIPDRACL
jgi:hypothetical protein